MEERRRFVVSGKKPFWCRDKTPLKRENRKDSSEELRERAARTDRAPFGKWRKKVLMQGIGMDFPAYKRHTRSDQ